MVSSSIKPGTLNTALKEQYLLMRSSDLHQIFTRPSCWQDILLVKIWLGSELRIKRYSAFSAVLSVPSKHHSALTDLFLELGPVGHPQGSYTKPGECSLFSE